MLLLESPPTPLDLKWQMFGIPVRVHPLFWLFTALLGLGELSQGFIGVIYLILWIVCVFVSILIHELGHVVTGRLFGSQGQILLYSFGGLAIGSSKLVQRWQRICVYLAGPASQFLLLLIIAVPYSAFALASPRERNEFLSELFSMLFVINLFWPILNLMPVWPLDGGQVSRELFETMVPQRGLRTSLIVSLVVALVLTVLGLIVSFYTAVLFGSLAYCSWLLLSQLPPVTQGKNP